LTLSSATGIRLTATGAYALASNTTGAINTGTGAFALSNNTTGGQNTAHGNSSLALNSTGGQNTAAGAGALFNNTTGSRNTAVGAFADVSSSAFTNATAIGYNAIADASNKIRLGDSAVTVIEGQVPFTFSSDVNQKENFRAVDGEDVLRKLRKFTLSSWNYVGHDAQTFRHYGPMAQDFYAAFGRDEIGTIGTPTTINSGDLAGILMIAVQALEKRLTEQGDDVEALTRENASLKARLETLENGLR
jgi:hypothetical protein